ncbi:hypothetical protein BsWGS_09507 [Bradybaena similaris]
MALPTMKTVSTVTSPLPQKSRLVAGTPNTSEKERNSSTPFLPSPHGHPNFNPTKSRGAASAARVSSASEGRVPKPPKPPDKPLMPYMRYSRKVIGKVWEQVKAQNPDLKLWEIGKIIGQMWRDLSELEKQEFQDEYEVEKIQYTDAIKAYHNSAAYQAWIAAKAEREAVDEDEPVVRPERPPAPAPKSASKSEGSRISILPSPDDEDLEDGFTTKHIAQARYLRNHQLINEIFSDTVVPDVRSVVTETRMTVLKKQVQSLTMHQKKLEGELQQIEEKHEQKKRKFLESSETFIQDLKKLCESKPQITEDMFNSMVAKAVKEELKLRQQQQIQQQQDEDRKRPHTQAHQETEQAAGDRIVEVAEAEVKAEPVIESSEPMDVDQNANVTSTEIPENKDVLPAVPSAPEVEAPTLETAIPSPAAGPASEETSANMALDKSGTESPGTPSTVGSETKVKENDDQVKMDVPWEEKSDKPEN